MAIHTIVKLDHFSRVGLRYLDAIIPKVGEEVSDYLHPSLRGLNPAGPLLYSMSEASNVTPIGPLGLEGRMVTRAIQANGKLTCPPDSNPFGLVFLPKFAGLPEMQFGMIDIDHSVELIFDPETRLIELQLAHLHEGTSAAFHAMLTPHAMAAWD